MSPTSAEPLPVLDSLWDFDKPDLTERKFRDLLPTAERSGDIGYYAELLTQVARTQGLQRKFDEAHKTLDRAEALIQPTFSRARVRYMLERGRLYNTAGKPSMAKPLFLDAWESARKAGEDGLAVDAAHMVAIVEKPEEALAWNLKAIAYAENSPDPKARKWLASLYNNTGWTHHDKGDYAKALDLFQKALELREEGKSLPDVRVAKWSVARTYRSLGRLQEALEVQRALARELEAANEVDGYVYEELGECLQALGKGAEATPHFARAYLELAKDQWLVDHEAKRLERLKELGQL